MQAYNPSFARIYNLRWTRFAQQLAPRLRGFYESTPVGASNHTLLDVCCGTGQLAQYFLDLGYRVAGLDLSPAMLDFARQNNAPYLISGQARFIEADASNFKLDEYYGLVVSTFDALNHLPDLAALRACFRSVFAALAEGGWFIFDLNTEVGLQNWSGLSVEDTADLMLVMRSIYDPSSRRAFSQISGFYPAQDAGRPGLYERFEETTFENVFVLKDVENALRESGFSSIRFTRSNDFSTPVEEPERESRIFIVTQK